MLINGIINTNRAVTYAPVVNRDVNEKSGFPQTDNDVFLVLESL